jgi:hypothetical protein
MTTTVILEPEAEPVEQALDDFDPAVRRRALQEVLVGEGAWPTPGAAVNLHCHTFYSYNVYGFSPTHFAVLARRHGLAVAGIVDFDVLDGLNEFLEASQLLGLKGVVSLESRVFVPEFADLVVNSPGEPGIAYHMGVGFTRVVQHPFLTEMRAIAQRRILGMLTRVNSYMHPVELDYDRDVLPLTPNGNATERHLCVAFERKARCVFPEVTGRTAFWRKKLGASLSEGAELQNLIRTKTLKKGGVGYVQPDTGAFPSMAEMNRFVLDAGAIPTLAWLDGTTQGEKELDRLLAVGMSAGAAAVNIIPDRNYTPGVSDSKLRNLYRVTEAAVDHHMPVIVGTEMHAPGNKFVDDFKTSELAPLVPVFLRGARIVYAHSILQQAGFGYLSEWAAGTFTSTKEKNTFFEEIGRHMRPAATEQMRELPEDPSPDQILRGLAKAPR